MEPRIIPIGIIRYGPTMEGMPLGGMVRAWIILKGIIIEPWQAMDYSNWNNGMAMAQAMAPRDRGITMERDSPEQEGRHGEPWRCLAQADPNLIKDMVRPWLKPTRTPWLATAYRRFPGGEAAWSIITIRKTRGRPVGRMGWIAM